MRHSDVAYALAPLLMRDPVTARAQPGPHTLRQQLSKHTVRANECEPQAALLRGQCARQRMRACVLALLQPTRAAEGMLLRLANHVSALKKLVDMLGGAKDTIEHRHRIADTNSTIQVRRDAGLLNARAQPRVHRGSPCDRARQAQSRACAASSQRCGQLAWPRALRCFAL